jgi:hypothetical protein
MISQLGAVFYLDSSALVKRCRADDDLLQASHAEGLSTKDPNQHP